MPPAVSPQWQEKASDFISSSRFKLKEAGQSAGTFVGEVAKDAKGNVAGAAGKVGSLVKSRWSLLQQATLRPSSKDAMQERLRSAAASTGTLLRKGMSETKDKVVVGKVKVEEVAKKTAQRSKTILNNIERWQKGVASTDGFHVNNDSVGTFKNGEIDIYHVWGVWNVFGVAIELTVQRQQSTRPIPQILVKCADYLILSGLNSEHLFRSEGDKKVIQHLISTYNQDWNASLPEGANPIDIAALVKCYLASLPEPVTTFDLYHEIRDARSSILKMRSILKKLPNVNYMTLEFITALLLRVSQKSLLNKMDAHSLAVEMSPVIIWQKGKRPDHFSQFCCHTTKGPSKNTMDQTTAYSAWDILSEEGDITDASSAIPLDDDDSPTDFGAVEVVQCLIEHHNAIFTDLNETVWR